MKTFTYMHSISIKVSVYISRLNRLAWHDGFIPDEEVWVKIRGDKAIHHSKYHSSL